MKALGTEFEAHGLGLIVAAMAVFLVLTAIVIGSAAMSKPVSGILDGNAQAEPITPVRPPP